MSPYTRIKELLAEPRTVHIVTHEKPDGDAVGSAFGLALILEKAGHSVTVYMPEGIPERVAFCPKPKVVYNEVPSNGSYVEGVLFVVDCSQYSRTGEWAAELDYVEATVVNLDHHVTNDNFGDVNLVLDLSSASELVYQLADDLGWEVTKDAATALMIGLLSDTLGLRTEQTNWVTLGRVAELASLGADLPALQNKLYHSRPLRQLQSWGLPLARLQTCGNVAFTWVEKNDYRVHGASEFEAVGILEMIGLISDVSVQLLMVETLSGDYKVSLRSKTVDVSGVAQAKGGGGHRQAAGFSIKKADIPFDVHPVFLAKELIYQHIQPLTEKNVA